MKKSFLFLFVLFLSTGVLASNVLLNNLRQEKSELLVKNNYLKSKNLELNELKKKLKKKNAKLGIFATIAGATAITTGVGAIISKNQNIKKQNKFDKKMKKFNKSNKNKDVLLSEIKTMLNILTPLYKFMEFNDIKKLSNEEIKNYHKALRIFKDIEESKETNNEN